MKQAIEKLIEEYKEELKSIEEDLKIFYDEKETIRRLKTQRYIYETIIEDLEAIIND